MPLSGPWWVSQYPGSKNLMDLAPTFRSHVVRFISVLTQGGAEVDVTATRRPKKRAFLMHWSWCIVNRWHGAVPTTVPAYIGDGGIDIQWVHRNAQGAPDMPASLRAARQMVHGFQIQNLGTPPALNSLHVQGHAIDMRITWRGTLTLDDPPRAPVVIDTTPRDSTNAQLIAAAATYHVRHFVSVHKDAVHWSTTGH